MIWTKLRLRNIILELHKFIDADDMKMRRGGSSSAGLFAFPRVGRRDLSMMEYNPWDIVLPLTYEEYDLGILLRF